MYLYYSIYKRYLELEPRPANDDGNEESFEPHDWLQGVIKRCLRNNWQIKHKISTKSQFSQI